MSDPNDHADAPACGDCSVSRPGRRGNQHDICPSIRGNYDRPCAGTRGNCHGLHSQTVVTGGCIGMNVAGSHHGLVFPLLSQEQSQPQIPHHHMARLVQSCRLPYWGEG